MSDERDESDEVPEYAFVFPPGLRHLFRKRTPEEEAQITAEQRAEIASGELNYDTLPHFGETAACAACGFHDSYAEARAWCKVHFVPPGGARRIAGERAVMAVHCRQCEFLVFERPLFDRGNHRGQTEESTDAGDQ